MAIIVIEVIVEHQVLDAALFLALRFLLGFHRYSER
jgi:hypothetical protein